MEITICSCDCKCDVSTIDYELCTLCKRGNHQGV